MAASCVCEWGYVGVYMIVCRPSSPLPGPLLPEMQILREITPGSSQVSQLRGKDWARSRLGTLRGD